MAGVSADRDSDHHDDSCVVTRLSLRLVTVTQPEAASELEATSSLTLAYSAVVGPASGPGPGGAGAD